MKKTLLGTIVAVAFSSVVLPASASVGTITINGTINSTTCVASIGAGKDATINLNPLDASSLASATATAGYETFTISLKDCGSATNQVNAFFEPGSTVDMATGHLVNVAPSATAAKNVQVQLLNKNQQVIKVGDATTARAIKETIVDGKAEMKYGVRYYATGAATAGALTTSVTYSIEYH
ncbi:fimbrial protein [Mixta intestinalis]|uniref:Major fimbrial subunit SMF-1 n=1 Tax=Mixta intestinalis TaxID=1615494 RepID=A0A6P1Q4M0_9GAMM|nr:fimbrial protein [Mixta intestinalis]QHM73154.1 Major fimbrial subunit SMF-1 [Mixta intestinalis]